MNEEKLNISLRKFLKNVGITSQRKIEDKVKESIDSSKITSSKKIKISAQLVSIDLNLDEKIEGEIERLLDGSWLGVEGTAAWRDATF